MLVEYVGYNYPNSPEDTTLLNGELMCTIQVGLYEWITMSGRLARSDVAEHLQKLCGFSSFFGCHWWGLKKLDIKGMETNLFVLSDFSGSLDKLLVLPWALVGLYL